jgi:hypothetical protein
MAPTGWSKTSSPDQARTGIQIDCTTLPLVASPNGGTWTRMADKITAQEAIYRTIAGFTAGSYYQVSFQQSLVKNWARSSGNVKVTIGSTSINSTTIPLPSASVAQTSWQTVTVGPFLATASTMTVSLEAHSNQDGTGSSPMPGACSGYTQNALAADLMIDGITICPVSSLPLNFLSVDLISESNIHSLHWTISDTDNELGKFIVTSSNDLQSWKEIGEVTGIASSSHYYFSLPEPHTSQTYYRILAFTGTKDLIAVSSILSNQSEIAHNFCGWILDRNNEVLIATSSDVTDNGVLYDLKGNKVLTLQGYSGSKEIPVNHLPSGMYILWSHTPRENCSVRFVK